MTSSHRDFGRMSANTVKGNGVSFAENQIAWHHGVPTKEQLAMAAKELDVEVAW